MIISIDIEVLEKYDLTPDDFVFLFSLYHKINLDTIDIFPNFVPLEQKGFIKLGDTWFLTNEGKELFEPKGVEAMFLEFWTTYPMKVSNGRGGYRALRDANHTTKQAQVCFKKYEAILKRTPTLHKQIMEGLNNFLKNVDLRFMPGIEVFLNQHMWNKYLDNTKSEMSNDI